MEALSALSLAAAVVQTVEFGFKVLSKGNELYKSADGVLDNNAFLKVVVKDLKTLLSRITSSSTPASPAFDHFRDESLKVANELLASLDKLKVKGRVSRWKSLRKALKAVAGKEKITKWTTDLNMLRNEFNTHVGIIIL